MSWIYSEFSYLCNLVVSFEGEGRGYTAGSWNTGESEKAVGFLPRYSEKIADNLKMFRDPVKPVY